MASQPKRLSSGLWRVQVDVTRDGQRHRDSATFPTKAMAEGWAERRQYELRYGLVGSQLTVQDWHDRWWPARVVEDTTRATNRGRLDKRILPRFGAVRLDRLSPNMVQQWVRDLQADGLSAETVRAYARLLSVLCNAAVGEGLLAVNPCARVSLPPPGQPKDVFLTRAEVDKLALAAPLPVTASMIVVLAYTGLRWGELAGLDARSVDLDGGLLHVTQTLIDVHGQRRVKPYPKGRDRRSVPLGRRATEALGMHLEGRRSGLVFTLRDQPWARSTFRRWQFGRAVRASGVRDCRPHDLRHTFGSWLAQDGVPPVEIMRVMGHRSMDVTLRYLHAAGRPGDARILAALD